MSDLEDPQVAAAELRADIVAELWGIINDGDAPAAARVGAIDKLAKIEGAYKPAPKANTKRYKSLAEFYEDVEPTPQPEEKEEDAE